MGPTIAAALILGVAMVASSYLISGALDRAASRLDGLSNTMASAIKSAAAARPAAAPAARRRGPDPSRRLKVKTDGAPVRGAKTAKLEIVEISDFQ
ncbi:MAG: hypothetical protein ACE5FG_15480 [Myxococcota bacterium]